MECFAVGFLWFSRTNVGTCLFDGWMGSGLQKHEFQGLSWIFLIS